MTDKVCPNCGWQMNKSVNECIDCGWAEFNWGSLVESAKKLTQLKTGVNK
jgi:anaerobic ribonucleoside-triphosphate reductase